MSKKITLHIDENLYHRLELIFEDDEQGLKNFIINALRNHLKTINSST